MHCAACWEHLQQEEDLQDEAVREVDRVWGVLQVRMVPPPAPVEKRTVTGKSSVGKYPCPTGAQLQGNVQSSAKSVRVELRWLTSTHASPHYPLHTHTGLSPPCFVELIPLSSQFQG